MRADIRTHVKMCLSCAKNKGSTGATAPMLSYPTPQKPWDTVGIDLLKLPRSNNGMDYLLVCVDHFSRFVVLVPILDKSAFSVARALVSHLFHTFTTPKVLLSDNGTEFRNELVSEICEHFNIGQTFVVAYHPASNGLVERANRKVLEALRHVVQEFHMTWDEWIPQIASAINSSINASIGESPHFVIYGDDKRLPYDLLLEKPGPVYNVNDYVKVHLSVSQKIFRSVRERLDVSRQMMVDRQHKNAQPSKIVPGDIVFVAESERSSKLEPRFSGPWRVVTMDGGNKIHIRHLLSGVEKTVHTDNCKRVSGEFQVPVTSAMDRRSDAEESEEKVPSHTEDQLEYRKKLRSASRKF